MSLATSQRFGLWPSVWKLLTLRVRILYNNFRRSKLRTKIGMIVIGLLLLAAMVGLYLLSTFLLSLLESPQAAPYVNQEMLTTGIPTLVLTGAFFLTILTNFGVLLQALYLSRDMDFLITAPLPMRAVFLAKLLEAILPNFALYCAFSLPVLFGIGTARGYTLLYYPLVVIMLALLTLAAGGTAALLVMTIVRFVPARRVAEVVGGVGALVSVLCGQTGNILNGLGVRGQSYTNAFSALSRFNMPWSPISWAGQGLAAVGQARWLTGGALSLVSLGLAGGVFGGALLLAERLYYTGWSSMQGSVRKKRAAGKIAPAAQAGAAVAQAGAVLAPAAQPVRTAGLQRLLPRPVWGLIQKDFLLLRRDPRNMSQLITPLIIGFAMLFSSGRGFNEALGNQFRGWSLINAFLVVPVAIFVAWILLMNLGTRAFSREGQSYWLIKSAPMKPQDLLLGKYIVSYLPGLVLCLAFLALAFPLRHAQWVYFPFCALATLLSVAGANGVVLAFGAAAANLTWDSSHRQQLRGSAGCIAPLVAGAFLAVNLALFGAPPVLWTIFLGPPPLLVYLGALVLGGVAAVLGAYLPPRMVMARLARIGEEE
jgi:ABC-2 type transport system permease protein